MAAPVGTVLGKNIGSICGSQKLLTCALAPLLNYTPVMYMRKKHFDPKFKKRRSEKVLFVERIDLLKEKEKQEQPFHERRKEMKKEGVPLNRTFTGKELSISSSGTIFDEYLPPEGDGKLSRLTKEGIKDQYASMKSKVTSQFQMRRRLKQYEENFSMKEIAYELQNLYIEVQQLLQDIEKNETRLRDLVTDTAYPKMTFGLDKKTFRWEFVESVEPPKTVQVRCEEAIIKENMFAQVTVRFHTRQKLAVYDRFGRLMYGSPHLVKDVLEYVVFEKHIVNLYGKWRVHDKIIPSWIPPREPIHKTVCLDEPSDSQEKAVTKTSSVDGVAEARKNVE